MRNSYARSHAFVIAQSAAKPAAPMARYKRSSIDRLRKECGVDKNDEEASRFERPARTLDGSRPPAAPTAENDERAHVERQRHDALIVAAQVDLHLCVQPLAAQSPQERGR